MSGWIGDEYERLAAADELEISSAREDGCLRPFVIIWAVGSDGAMYVRSAHGRENGWFRRALASGRGRIRSGGVERDVTFEEPGPEVDADLDAAFHAKYDHYGPALVDPVVSAESARATLRLVPRPAADG